MSPSADSVIDRLCPLVQLHEEIIITYGIYITYGVVCDPTYTATLYSRDGGKKIAVGQGETILLAMLNLTDKVKGMSLSEVRNYQGKEK